jgi:hypothetical protein
MQLNATCKRRGRRSLRSNPRSTNGIQKDPAREVDYPERPSPRSKKVLHFEHSTSVVLKLRISVAEVCIQ